MSAETPESDEDEVCMLPPQTAGSTKVLTGVSDAHATGTTIETSDRTDYEVRCIFLYVASPCV